MSSRDQLARGFWARPGPVQGWLRHGTGQGRHRCESDTDHTEGESGDGQLARGTVGTVSGCAVRVSD